MEVQWTNYQNVENVRVLQRSVFLFSTTYRILFVNMETGERSSYTADGLHETTGDGVRVTAAHDSVPIFAFAEMVTRPRLLVKSYPSFGTVAILQSTEAQNYLSVCLSATDHLIALTGINSFSLEVWNWRTSQLLGMQRTDVLSIDQTISCSTSNQLSIVQYAKNLKKLKVWNVHFCLDAVKVTEIDLVGEKNNQKIVVHGYEMLKENSILFYNQEGDIFLSSIVKRTIQVISDKMGDIKTVSAVQKGFLCSTHNELFYFLESDDENRYVKLQSISVTSPILKIFPFTQSSSFGNSESGDWNQISLSPDLGISYNMAVNWTYKFLTIFQDNIILVTIENIIEVWGVEDKKKMKSFSEISHKDITCMTVNSNNANLIFGTSDSRVLIYLFFDLQLSLLHELFLSENAIFDVQYTENYLICIDNSESHFIVNAVTFEVLTYISHADNVLKLISIEYAKDELHLYFFEHTISNKFSSNTVQVFKYNSHLNLITNQRLDLPFPIASVAHARTMDQFLVNPYLTRVLKSLSIKSTDTINNIGNIAELSFESHLKYFQLQSNGESIIVYGLDGVIYMLNHHGELINSTTISHRLQGEIKGVVACPQSNHILIIDSELNIICVRTSLSEDSHKPTLTLEPPQTIPRPNISWLESRQNKNLQSEMQNNKQICQEITLQMRILRKEIQNLLDQNEMRPEDEKLPIQQFNLNETHHELLHQEAHSADMETKQEMLRLIEKEKYIQRWLMDNCWQVMDVKSTLIKGIFWDNCVENFSLLLEDPEMLSKLDKAVKRFKIEQLINSDVFQPFAPIDTNQLEKILSQEPRCCGPEENPKISKRTPEDLGTTTMNFVPPLFDRFTQMEVVTYQQCHMEELFGHFDVLSLKHYFNGRFNELQELKAEHMHVIRGKNERLRVIQSELNELALLCNSKAQLKDAIVDPEFTIEEKPERIIQVRDEEITCRPFQAISERTQQSDEVSEEDVIQEMFSSAFRDKCLQTMMDGVLEIRWEDEIKKTPAVPVALQARKDLRDYDEHDLRAVKEYEEKLNFLGEERNKYKDMLLDEKRELLREIQEIINSFNGKLCKLIEQKIDVEMAVNQETFKLLRNRQFNRMRIDCLGSENEIKGQVLRIKKEMAHLATFLHDFDRRIQDCKVQAETSEARDRQLDKHFKNNFAELSSHAIVDQAYKFFKRRSRWIPKPWATSAILNDMARRVITRNLESSGPPLHEDCFEFLKTLEQHDQVTNCPNIMDDRLWEWLCRMRRSKVESEFRVRALTALLSEADQAEQAMSKEISFKKLALVGLDRKMSEVREKKHVNVINRTVQLVVKRGAIEVDLSGKLSDFDGVILIGKSEVDDINNMIRRAGMKKLAAMNNAAIFRRKVLNKEWEHQVLKMKIRDIRNFLSIVEKCKITKDVQRWLSKKQKGRTDDVSQVALNKEIDSMIGGFEKELLQVETELKTICRKVQLQRTKNQKLDSEIESLNFEVNAQHKLHDPELEENIVTDQNNRLCAISERTRLMRRIQKQHAQIVELTALLELQRLRTYPTLNEYR